MTSQSKRGSETDRAGRREWLIPLPHADPNVVAACDDLAE
jgi:hypothetical protein